MTLIISLSFLNPDDFPELPEFEAKFAEEERPVETLPYFTEFLNSDTASVLPWPTEGGDWGGPSKLYLPSSTTLHDTNEINPIIVPKNNDGRISGGSSQPPTVLSRGGVISNLSKPVPRRRRRVKPDLSK